MLIAPAVYSSNGQENTLDQPPHRKVRPTNLLLVAELTTASVLFKNRNK